MTLLRGVEFSEQIAPVVTELLHSLDAMIGADRWYTVDNGIRYALKPSDGESVADGVIFRMGATKNGAFIRRGRGSKRPPKQINLNRPDDLAETLNVARGWFEDVQATWQEKKTTRRNPAWTRDELILALDLYFRLPPWTINGQHESVLELSQTLGKLSAIDDPPDAVRYRNPSGTYMKLMNLRYKDPDQGGKGLKGGGALEDEIWREFGFDREKLSRVVATIRAAIADGSQIASELNQVGSVDESEEAVEGAILTRLHRVRERDKRIVRLKKSQVLNATGALKCEVCTFDFLERYGELGREYIECHHTRPLFQLKVGETTKMTDLALVCANCHRMLHAARAVLSLDALRALLS